MILQDLLEQEMSYFNQTDKFCLLSEEVFFKPWVGQKYEEGLHGVKTMILAPHHWCAIKGHELSSCLNKKICCSNRVREVDEKCPYELYRGKKLSDENIIEIQRFIGGADHNVFVDFSCGLLGTKKDDLDKECREQLCSRILFQNFLQHYVPDRHIRPYNLSPDRDRWSSSKMYLSQYKTYMEMYGKAIPALKEIIKIYAPEVIITWGNAIHDTLRTTIAAGELDELSYAGKIIGFTVDSSDVHLFTCTGFEKVLPFEIDTIIDIKLQKFYNDYGVHIAKDRQEEYAQFFKDLKDLKIIDINSNKPYFDYVDGMRPGKIKKQNASKLTIIADKISQCKDFTLRDVAILFGLKERYFSGNAVTDREAVSGRLHELLDNLIQKLRPKKS